MKNQLLTLLTFIALSATGFASEDCCGCSDSESCCTPEPKPCIDCICYTPAYHDLQCDWGVFLDIEFLYWYARENDLPYAYTLEAVEQNHGLDPELVPSSTTYVGTSWDPGVRGGIGFNLCDGWDVGFYWTYFKNDKKSSSSVPTADLQNLMIGDKVFINPWLVVPPIALEIFGSGGFFTQLNASWEFRINVFDAQIGRRYWLSRCFNLRPFIGVKGAWTDTKFNVQSSGEFKDIITISDSRFKNSFKGAGIVGGLQPTWYFTRCFALYGDINFALLWGKFENKLQGSTLFSVVTPQVDFSYKPKSKFYGMQSVLDAGIGLRWEDTWCCDRYRSSLDIGWEHQIWLEHNIRRIEAISLFSVPDRYSVGFGGLVVRGRFDF